MRLIIDTNLHLSYLISSDENSTVRHALKNVYRFHEPFQSHETFAEMEKTLFHQKFARYFSKPRAKELIEEVRNISSIIQHSLSADISDDPKDNKFFALAEAVQADYILSGDKKHVLSIPAYKGIRTVSAAAFLEIHRELAQSGILPAPRKTTLFK